jgi:MMP 1-O-methyltransferase
MKAKYQAIKNLVRDVNGFLTDREGMLLYRYAEKCQGQGVIVEIGSWQGLSTTWLAMGSLAGAGGKIYAIDPHTGSEEHQVPGKTVWTFENFCKNMKNAKIKDLVEPIVKYSFDAINDVAEPIELLFIDGAHDYENVKRDYDLWAPKVIDGGFVLFHDCPCEGVKKVLNEVFDGPNFRRMFFSDTLTGAQKVAKNTALDRKRNARMLALRQKFQEATQANLPRKQKTRQKNNIKFQRWLISLDRI